MTESNIPPTGGKSQPHAKNSDKFSSFSGRSVTATEFLASIDQGNKYHLQVDDALRDHPLITDGMRDTLAAIKSLANNWGYLSLSPKVKALLGTMTGFAPDTLRKHFTALAYYTLIYQHKKINNETVVIHAGPFRQKREKAARRYADLVADDNLEREKRDKKLKADRERKAAARAARAQMRGKGSEEPKQADAQSEEVKEAGTDMPLSRHVRAEELAPEGQNLGMPVPSHESNVQPSYIKTNSIFKNTTHESIWLCSVEESRACEDAEREGVVFSFDSFCGEEKEWVEWDGEYGDSDVPEYVETFEDVSDEELNIVVLSDTDTEPVVPPGPDDDDDDPFADAGFVALRAAACRAAAARKNDPFADDDVLKDDVLPVPTIPTATAVAGPAPRKSAAASSQLIDELSREFQLPVSEIDSELTRVTPGCSQVMFDLVLAEAQKVYSARRESKKPITDPWPWFVGTVRNTAGIALTAARENGGKQPSGIYYQMSPERQREVFSLTVTHPRQAEFDALLDRQGRLQTVISKLCPKHTGVFDDLNVAKKARIKSDAFTSWLREVEKTG